MVIWIFDYIPLPTLVSLIVFVLYSLISRRIDDMTVIVSGSLILEGIHQLIELTMRPLFASDEYFDVVLVVWYVGFGITDFLLVLAVVFCCRFLRVLIRPLSWWILHCYIAMGIIQLIRFAERMITDTEYLEGVYTKGIPLLTYLVSVLLVISLIQLIINRRRDAQIWSESD